VDDLTVFVDDLEHRIFYVRFSCDYFDTVWYTMHDVTV